MRRDVSWLALVWLIFVPVAAHGAEFRDDLAARRARLMGELGLETMLVMFSAPVRVYSNDVDYEYRQDSNFYYVTGIEQPESILVLMPGNVTRKEILFIVEPDPMREHWEGRMLRRNEATAQSGIAAVFFVRQFQPFIDSILTRRPFDTASSAAGEYDAFFNALANHMARLSLVLDPPPNLSGRIGDAQRFGNDVKDRFLGVTLHDATDLLHQLRQVKTTYERSVLARSVEISSEAHLAGMRAVRPGGYEYEVKAAIEYTFLKNGAYGWGYPSIVGSGPNATILHYSASRRRMEDGDLLLVDAAANYQYLTGDITRTYPVNGTFTEAQKEIYEVVLEAQEAGLDAVRVGVTPNDIHDRTVEVITRGLLRLGLITDASGGQYRLWYTHGAVHFIGLDVHDVGDRSQPLEPGMTFVVEPGIYVRGDALESLRPTLENRDFIEQVRPAFEKYKHIGVRVEDSVLLTESGPVVLSATVPKTIEDVEAYMKRAPASGGR